MKENGFTLKKKPGTRQYPVQTIIAVDYADDIALLSNKPTQSECLLHNLELAAGGISFHMNEDKT